MTSFDAGSAHASYTIDISQVEQAAARLKALFQGIKQDAANLGTGNNNAAAAGLNQQGAAAQRAQANIERLRDSEIRAARAADEYAKAMVLVDIQLKAAERDTIRYNNLLAIQAQLQKKLKPPAPTPSPALPRVPEPEKGGGLAATAQGINTGLSAIGLTLGIRSVANFTAEAGKAALELDHTQRVTRELAGSTAVYNQIVAEARNQQRLFGGSLQENIDGLSGLAVTAKVSGAGLNQLIDLQKRLTILNPAQGAQGGLIALNEALAGNIASLSRRFNIPRAELQKLNDTALPVADRLKVLDQFLNKVGVTSEAVSRATSETAQTYNKFSAELDNSKVAIGNLIANLGKIPAKIVTTYVLQPVSSGIGTIANIDNQLQQFNSKALQGADTFAQYDAKINDVNEQLRVFGVRLPGTQLNVNIGQVDKLTKQQFEYAQALQHSGVSFDDALVKVQKYAGAIQAGGLANTDFGQTSAQFTDRLIALSEGSDGSRLAVENLSRSFLEGNLEAGRFAQAIGLLEIQQERQRQATAEEAHEQRRLLGDVPAYNQALVEQASKTLQASQETERQKDLQEGLATQGTRVKAGFITAAEGAAILAQQYGLTSDQARDLLDLQLKLSNSKAALVRQEAGPLDSATRSYIAQAKSVEDQLAATKALEDRTRSVGSLTERLALARRKAADAVKQFGSKSPEAIEAGTEVIRLQQEADRAGQKRVNAAEKTANQLATVEENSGLQLARIQRENLERLRDQQEDFEVGKSRKQEDFERERRRLLAQGQRAAAARLSEDFQRDTQRASEDFNRQRGRTLRNNQEGTGDVGARTDLRQSQILGRAGLTGGVAPGRAAAGLPSGPGAVGGGGRGAVMLQIQVSPVSVQIDGHTVVTATWPEFRELIDIEMAEELGTIGIVLPPGGNQSAVAGPTP